MTAVRSAADIPADVESAGDRLIVAAAAGKGRPKPPGRRPRCGTTKARARHDEYDEDCTDCWPR